jgi:hypothetical protein
MYVKNIEVESKEKVQQAEEKVRKYLQNKEIYVYKAQVIKNRFADTIVGCKITVAEQVKEKLEGSFFWPDHIECRPWGRKWQMKPNREESNERGHHEADDNYYRRKYDDNERRYDRHNDRHYDEDMEDNDFWWSGGYDRN